MILRYTCSQCGILTVVEFGAAYVACACMAEYLVTDEHGVPQAITAQPAPEAE